LQKDETSRPDEKPSRPPSEPGRHPREAARTAAVADNAPLTRKDDPAMLSVARQAAAFFGTPVGMVSLLEQTEEWVVACVGVAIERVPRAVSFCAHAVLEPDILIVEDASVDARFADNPHVLGEHHLRFYAGAPVFDAGGLPLGAVCVCDAEPRTISTSGLFALRRFADAAASVLEARLILADAQSRFMSLGEKRAVRDRLDGLLLALVEGHPRSE